MAQSGGNRKTSSKLQKVHYQSYKLNNTVLVNKKKKLERHCKAFPNDKKCAERLAELKKTGKYNPRSKPLNPGSNQTIPTPKLIPSWAIPHGFNPIKTAGEQLSVLLGIPLVRTTRKSKRKTKVTIKKKKNVKT